MKLSDIIHPILVAVALMGISTPSHAGRCSDAEAQYTQFVESPQAKIDPTSGAKKNCKILIETLKAEIRFLEICPEADPDGDQMRAFEEYLAGAINCVNSF